MPAFNSRYKKPVVTSPPQERPITVEEQTVQFKPIAVVEIDPFEEEFTERRIYRYCDPITTIIVCLSLMAGAGIGVYMWLK